MIQGGDFTMGNGRGGERYGLSILLQSNLGREIDSFVEDCLFMALLSGRKSNTE